MTTTTTKPRDEPGEKQCNACSKEFPKDKFSKKQWLGSVTKQRRCKGCVESNGKITSVSKKPSYLTMDEEEEQEKQQEQQQQQQQQQRKSKKKTRKAPTYAGNQQERCYKPNTNNNSFMGIHGIQAKLAMDMCAWCGKTEEKEQLLECSACKNILYCNTKCYKLAYPEHKLVCEQMKKDRKQAKKEGQKILRKGEKKFTTGALSEASGTGSFFINITPIHNTPSTPGSGSGDFCIVSYTGELRGNEQPGEYFASDTSRDAIRTLMGSQGFQMYYQHMQEVCIKERGTFHRSELYSNVDELNPIDQFLLSCGPFNDIDRAKLVLPYVLHMISVSVSGLKPDGSIPTIGDIKVRGYGLNAIEWAARRGNYDIAEWLATDSRTKVLLTRTDSAPVAWACYTNQVELARMLVVKYGVNSHATTECVFANKPPAHLASENGKLLALKFLIEECHHDILEYDTFGQDMRASLRRNNPKWTSVAGCVACDEYAKEKGVEGEIIRSKIKRRQNEVSTTVARQQQQRSSSTSSLEENLSEALRRLEIVGGREDGHKNYNDADDGDDDEDSVKYLTELLAVADARCELKQYNQAGGLYYRAYYAAQCQSDTIMNTNRTIFPIAHKMIQSWMKSNDEHYIKQAFGMAKQNCMEPGHPSYIEQDMIEVGKIMKKKGIKMEP